MDRGCARAAFHAADPRALSTRAFVAERSPRRRRRRRRARPPRAAHRQGERSTSPTQSLLRRPSSPARCARLSDTVFPSSAALARSSASASRFARALKRESTAAICRRGRARCGTGAAGNERKAKASHPGEPSPAPRRRPQQDNAPAIFKPALTREKDHAALLICKKKEKRALRLGRATVRRQPCEETRKPPHRALASPIVRASGLSGP